jgi:hypothetical protein
MNLQRREFLKTSTVVGLAGITGVASGVSLGCNASDVIKAIAAQLPNLAQMALSIAQIVNTTQGRNILPPVPLGIQTAITDTTNRIKGALDELSNPQGTGFLDQYNAASKTGKATLQGQIAAVLHKLQQDMSNILSIAGIENVNLRTTILTIAGVANGIIMGFLALPMFAQAQATTTALIGNIRPMPVTAKSDKPEDITKAVLTNILNGSGYSEFAK